MARSKHNGSSLFFTLLSIFCFRKPGLFSSPRLIAFAQMITFLFSKLQSMTNEAAGKLSCKPVKRALMKYFTLCSMNQRTCQNSHLLPPTYHFCQLSISWWIADSYVLSKKSRKVTPTYQINVPVRLLHFETKTLINVLWIFLNSENYFNWWTWLLALWMK